MRRSLTTLLLTTLLSTTAYSADLGLTFGAHDMFVSNIDTPEFDGGTSHTLGANLGVFATHTTARDIKINGTLDFYLDHDKDHLDPDHIPVWYKFQFDIDGPIYQISEGLSLRWLLEMKNKINTVSSIEREVKQFLGADVEYESSSVYIALKAYSGFFYLEIDDDAPEPYGYERKDLGNGTSAISLMLDTRFKITEALLVKASLQNWSSTGVGSSWLENELVVDVSYSTEQWIKGSRVHLNIDAIKYNLDPYYRADLGVPVLPWDNDTLIRAYMSIPWKI